MSWERSIDLIYDVESTSGSPLLKIEGSSITSGSAPVLVQGDHAPLRIFLKRRASDGSLEAVSIPAGYSLLFAGKKSDLTGNLLFSASSFVETGTGDDLHYLSDLDLNTADMATALSTVAEVTARCDLEIQNFGNTRRYTIQVDIKIRKQAYAGEGSPVEADPPYPAPDQLALRDPGATGNYRFWDGETLQLLNVETDAYESIEARHQSGIVLVIEDGAMAVYVNGFRRGAI